MHKKIFTSALLIISVFFYNQAYADNKDINNTKLEKEAFATIAKALFNDKVHINMKVDMFTILKNLAPESEEEKNKLPSDLIEDFYSNIISDPYNSTLTVDILAGKQNEKKEETKPTPKTELNPLIIEILREGINNENDTIKLYSIETIKKAKLKALQPDIITLLNNTSDDNINLKTTLITTLGEIGDESTVDVLKKSLDSPVIRFKLNALQAISSIDAKNTDEIISKYIKEGPLELALLAAGILAQKDNKEAIELLQQGISSPVELTKQKTLIALSNVTNPAILPILKTAIDTENEAIQAYCLNLLANIDVPESIEIINSLMPEEKLTARALIALSKNSSPDIYEIYNNIINSDEALKKSYTVAILSQMDDEKILPLLRSALKDKNENTRVAAAKIMHTYKDESGLNVLKEALKSKDEDISLNAAAYLGFAKDDSGIEILEEAVTNTDLPSWKRLDISFILDNLNKSSMIPIMSDLLEQQRPTTLPKDLAPTNESLKKLLKNDSTWVKLNTSIIMTRHKDDNCLPTLIELTKDPDLKIRTVAAMQMGLLGNKTALPALRTLLDDDSVRVRVKAAEAIIKILEKEDESSNQKA